MHCVKKKQKNNQVKEIYKKMTIKNNKMYILFSFIIMNIFFLKKIWCILVSYIIVKKNVNIIVKISNIGLKNMGYLNNFKTLF